MATCNTWEAPFIGDGVGGNSVSDVCTKLWSIWGISEPDALNPQLSGDYCSLERSWGTSATTITQQCEPAAPGEPGAPGQTITCGAACSISVKLEPAPPSEEHMADIGLMFGGFAVVCTIVYCGKQLINLFTVKHHED